MSSFFVPEQQGIAPATYSRHFKRHTARSGLVGLVKFTGNLSVIPSAVYASPPPFCPLPQWFETVHANDVVGHLDELKSVITSTFGRILKLDSTKKVQ